jgi:hypothetical protein
MKRGERDDKLLGFMGVCLIFMGATMTMKAFGTKQSRGR